MEQKIAVADTYPFSYGDIIVLKDWPHWMYRWHVPYWIRKTIRRVGLWLGKDAYGPQEFIITGMDFGELTVEPWSN